MQMDNQDVAMGKEEIKDRIKEALNSYIEKMNEKSKGRVVIKVEATPQGLIFKTVNVMNKDEVIKINNLTSFFEACILSLAMNLAEKLQAKILLKSVGKKVFSEIEEAILKGLEGGKNAVIAEAKKEINVYVFDKNILERSFNFDAFF